MASVYGSHMISPNVSSTIENKNTIDNALPISYANRVKTDMFPTKSEAIILDSVDGIPLKEYIKSIGDLIDPKNIKFVSRISKNRICMYLANKDIVNSLTLEPTMVKINDNEIVIRPLLTKYRRIIISNVCPIIPHYVLENKLIEAGIRLGSKITFLRVGLSEPGYGHIMSFRRQVFIHPDDFNKMPESLKIEYDGTPYWVYLSSDTMTCFICKTQGHPAKHCPMNKTTDDPDFSEVFEEPSVKNDVVCVRNELPSQSASVTAHYNTEEFPPLPARLEDKQFCTIEKPPKRPLSTTTSSTDNERTEEIHSETSSDENTEENHAVLKKLKCKKQKKIKTESLSIDTQLSPIKPLLTKETNPYILDYDQLKNLLETFQNCSNIVPVALEYTNNISDIVKLLKETHPLLTERSIKIKFTKLQRILTNHLENINSHQLSLQTVVSEEGNYSIN